MRTLEPAGALAMEPAPRSAESGELRLLAALLACALDDARAGRTDALAWIASDEAAGAATGWSFADVCAALRVDPSWARARVAGRGRVRGRARVRRRRMRAAA